MNTEPTDERHPDLVGLLRGELDNAEAISAGAHLRTCEACRDELAESAVGHALLARARRTLGPDVGTPSADAAGPGGAPAAPTVEELLAALPDEPETPRRRRSSVLLLVAVVALVASAGLGAVAQRWLDDRSPSAPVAQRSATFEPVTGAGSGQVSMTEADGQTTMRISTHDLPAAHDGQFYYAWLLDPATNKMLPLGQVGPSGTASFELSDALLAAYTAVDVSLEDDDGDPQHSPTSVLRATYA